MKDRFYIDEIARQLGLTKRTIRYYEEQGLLDPADRTEKGYRVYTEKDTERLSRIVELRDTTGFSLKDIKEILQVENNISQGQEAFHGAGAALEKKRLLEGSKTELLRLIDLIEHKKVQLEKIESIYREKLSCVEKCLNELECDNIEK